MYLEIKYPPTKNIEYLRPFAKQNTSNAFILFGMPIIWMQIINSINRNKYFLFLFKSTNDTISPINIHQKRANRNHGQGTKGNHLGIVQRN